MESSRRFALALVLIVAAFVVQAQSNASRSINVTDAASLAAAIGSDRTVVLKKGEYRLSAATRTKSDFVSWSEDDGVIELSISGVKNLTLRGAEGAKILLDGEGEGDSIIGLYDSSNVTFDNLSFVRSSDSEAELGAFYAEAVSGLTIDRCAFKGGSSIALELWECSNVAVKRTEISGTKTFAVSASSTKSLAISGSKVMLCEGFACFSFEDSEGVVIKGSVVEGNTVDSLIEIYGESYPEEGVEPAVRFEDCGFANNDVLYFCGTPLIPVAEGCRFEGNSFGEDWAVASVASAVEEPGEGEEEDSGEYWGDEGEGPQVYEHPAGLSLTYPGYWELQEYEGKERVGFFSPDGKSLVIFLLASELGANADPAKQAKKVFADAYAAFAKLLKAESGVSLDLKAEGEPYTDNGLLSADYRGLATKGEGEKAQARARFVVSNLSIYVMVGLAEDSSAFEPEGDIDGIFASIVATAEE
jgi:hypothetical protein